MYYDHFFQFKDLSKYKLCHHDNCTLSSSANSSNTNIAKVDVVPINILTDLRMTIAVLGISK
jgi:hypothetical protein